MLPYTISSEGKKLGLRNEIREYSSMFRDVFSNKNILAISLTTSLYSLVAQGYRPFWTLYLKDFLGATYTNIGIFSMISTAENLLFQLPGGMLADRYGRRKIILVGTFIRTFSPILYFLAPSWEWAIPAAIVSGMTSLYMPAFNAIIADSLPSKRRGAGYGAYNTLTSIPQIISPFIGGIIMEKYGYYKGVRMFLLLQIGVSLLTTAIRYFTIKETMVHQSGKRPSTKITRQTFRELPKQIVVMMVVSIIASFSGRLVMDFTSLYALEVIRVTPVQLGLINTIVGIISVALALPGGMLSDRYGRKKNIMVSRVVSPVTQYLFTVATGFETYTVIRAFNSVGLACGGGGLTTGGPAWNALIADIVPPEKRATINGIMGTLTAVVGAPSSVLGGWLWQTYHPQLPFQVSMIIGLIAATIFWFGVDEPSKSIEE